VDPGETAPVAAVREVFEETGHHCALGRRLVAVSYPIEQGDKKVYYWAARSTGGEFAPGKEVDELVWLPVAEAMKKLDYEQDRKVLRRFAKQPADTRTMLVVRHGTASREMTPSAPWTNEDERKPRHWSHNCWPSAPRTCMRPTACAVTRRWNHSPRNWVCRSKTSPP
jgi:ADP-ribose pyrophosphatase YjhB (NUDIX family)